MKRITLTMLVIASFALVAHAHDLPTCGQPNYELMWGCLDKSHTIRPYCDKLHGDINMRAYCYDGYKQKVSTWDQYRGYINDPCYVAPDVKQEHDDADCVPVERPVKTGDGQ